MLVFQNVNTIQIQQPPTHVSFSFRRKHDMNVGGISLECRKQRKNRNLVTVKFNMFNWILETLSTFLVLIFRSRILSILYIITLSCGTPVVYFLGIEENRRKVKEYFIANIRTFSKKKENKQSNILVSVAHQRFYSQDMTLKPNCMLSFNCNKIFCDKIVIHIT